MALRSQAVPARIATAECAWGWDAHSVIFIEAAGRRSEALRRAIAPFGGTFDTDGFPDDVVTKSAPCWFAVMPLVKDDRPPAPSDASPLLIEAAESRLLVDLARDLLSFGYDRFQWGQLDGSAAVLRVVSPPYYLLLKALDGGYGAALTVYREASPGVWIALGWRHPLEHLLSAAPETWLLEAAERPWRLLPKPSLLSMEQRIELALPQSRAEPLRGSLPERIVISLELRPDSAATLPSLWVFGPDRIRDWERFVETADSLLMGRLKFAVADVGGERCVLVRRRPGPPPEPEFLFPANEFRSFSGIDWLYLPVGKRLHPPVRPDVLRALFATEAEQIVWIEPESGSAFRVRSILEESFHPLSDWIEYVIARDEPAIAAWSNRMTFESEPYEVADEPPSDRSLSTVSTGLPRHDAASAEATAIRLPEVVDEGAPMPSCEGGGATPFLQTPALPSSIADLPERSPDIAAMPADDVLRRLQTEFLQAPGSFDSEERSRLWIDIAQECEARGDWPNASWGWLNRLWILPSESEPICRHWNAQAVAATPLGASVPDDTPNGVAAQ